jgi:Winged helix-turn helix
MPSAVRLREDYSAKELRALARRSKDVNQSRRLLSLAGVRDGMDRGGAAKIGGMDSQTLRDWVHRFNASGPQGLIDNWTEGSQASLVGAATDPVRADRRGWSGLIPGVPIGV